MKVLIINGSPTPDGNTYIALNQVAKALNEDGIETEILQLGKKPVPGCIACNKCKTTGVCIFNTGIYQEVFEKIQEADGFVVGSPTYYAGPNGSLCALLDRLFYSAGRFLEYKPGTAVGICRRGGSVCTVERLNKYFEMTNMPMPSSQYWNNAFGLAHGDVVRDAEGMQTMRTLGHNLARLLKALENVPRPAQEEHAWTSFPG
ncbi:MAG: flavodoxin family protein [Lachnoclostridium sp.]|nr:flavodoxin family protein [Lachnoclostridium sp.]